MIAAIIRFCTRERVVVLLLTVGRCRLRLALYQNRADRRDSKYWRKPSHRIHRVAGSLAKRRGGPSHLSVVGRITGRA